MSSTNRNFIIAYVLLVGLPLAGLAAVLRTGRGLTAPISVDGVWKLEADTSHTATQPCDLAVSSLLGSSLVLSQSGKTVALSFNAGSKSAVPGELQGNTIKASLAPLPSGSACGSDQVPTLVASVNPKMEPRSLTGTVSVSNCASCMPRSFRAVRQPRNPAGGGH